MKKRLINIFAFLVIVAIGFLATRYYEPAGVVLDSGVDLPHLKSMTPFPGSVLIVDDNIKVAFEVDRSSTEAQITADILEVYRWGRSRFNNVVLCGDDYPKELCKVGMVSIALIVGKETPSIDQVKFKVPMVIYYSWLEQRQIDHLLELEPLPANTAELLQFHRDIAQATLATAGAGTIFQTPIPFEGWPALTTELRSSGANVP